MVSSEIPSVTTTHTQRPNLFTGMVLLPKGPPDVVLPENVEFDFNDVFGATAVQTPTELSILTPDSPAPLAESNEEVYNDPVVITKRSHSLVGPTSLVSQSLPLSKLTLHESESSLDLLECLSKEKKSDQGALSDEELNNNTKEANEAVGLDDFELLKLVGQGAFGKVYQVRRKCTSEIYAMKVMRKDKVLEKNHAEYMKAERDILTKVDHPFVVQLRYSFQTKYRLYLVLDFVNGGHLFFQLYQQGLFREELARIYTAEIVSAVAHLHANGIMHRDLKPENILLDAHGHAMLTDFGLAKEFDENTRSNSMCGTVEYMAPEIVQGRGHDKAADWWSVGILLFEMLTGKPPFFGGNRDKIQQKIVKEKMKLPTYLSSEVHSLLKGIAAEETRSGIVHLQIPGDFPLPISQLIREGSGWRRRRSGGAVHPARARPPILSVALPSDTGRVLSIQSHTVQDTQNLEDRFSIAIICGILLKDWRLHRLCFLFKYSAASCRQITTSQS